MGKIGEGRRVVLFVSNDLVCDNRVHKMATTLMSHDFDVLVVGRKLRRSLSLPSCTYRQKRMRFLFSSGALFYAEMNIRYFFFLLFHKFDIATANDLDTLLGVFCAVRIRRKYIVYDSHEYFTELPELINRPIVRKIWKQIERKIFPSLKNNMTVCESIAHIYRNEYHVNVSVVRNVPYCLREIDKTDFAKEGKPIILYQGSLNVGRGLELLIQAMKYIHNAKLLLIGDGDISETLHSMVRESDLEYKVTFLGKIPYCELLQYTRTASVGVSLEEDSGLNYYFALPNKLFDYIQARKPVLVSDLPEMASVVKHYHCGEIMHKRTPSALAKQLSSMLKDKQTLNLYKKNCELASQELCWEKEEKIVLQVYGNLL